ncbi:MAG TPA: asparagine synthase (glutamine-hydrolyzing), partial [Usitatibacter sp.]|nr:asparagine synthase (glutamine-hydrolyzing) [Usitatibacter sp.]
MCGIAGILGRRAARAPERAELAAMIGRLRHRGPDGTGIHLGPEIGLAHARLSIIDLAGGAQPIGNEDGSVQVVLNGEIFNYVELREALERGGHQFRTRTDTEVLVHLYEDEGERFVEQLNGQFAFALWDARARRLVLARDRTGIRPLFHAERDGRLVFASEIKALFALPAIPRRIDRRALAEICTYWAPLAPRTAFEGIESLPPGHLLVDDERGRRVQSYWDWRFPEAHHETQRPEAELATALRELLEDAVRLQLRADVPVGAYLSGGLDSAVIAALARRLARQPVRTFSLTFEDAEFDESAYQEELVRFLGTEHTSIRCTREDIAAVFPRTIAHAETPIVRTAPAPLLLLSGHVREAGYKVVLTGEGADEVFGGYDLFKEAKVRRFWARSPRSPFRPRILERLYPYLKHSPAAGHAFSRDFFAQGMEHRRDPYFGHIPRWNTTGRIARFFSRSMREAVDGWDPLAGIAATLPESIGRWSPLARDQYIEAHTLMSGYLLCSQGDRMAMANSIEGRFPYLDHRVIEFANALPPEMKLRGLTEKFLLKEATRDLIPESVRARPKQPYRAPDSRSFFRDGKPVDYVAQLFSPKRIEAAGYFNPVATSRLFEKCRAGRAI